MAEDIPQNLILFPPRFDWLAKAAPEPILEPDLPIIDCHHHMWDIPGFWKYLFPDLKDDVNSGHNVVATVFIEAHAFWRADGPDHLKSVGEVEFVNGVAAMSASGAYGPTKFCAGIVGNADLTSAKLRETLDAHFIAAGGPNGRFRGIRHNLNYSDEPYYTSVKGTPGVMANPKLKEGMKELAKRGLTLDTWIFQTQLDELAELARACPDTKIILNHIGAPLRNGRFARDMKGSFDQWRKGMLNLGKCENVYVKIGGMGLRFCGFDFHDMPAPPTSQVMADAWKPYVETSIEAFGVNRSMFESDWPVEKDSCSYAALWNAFKILTKNASAAEKTALYSGTAANVYRIKT